MTAFDVGALVSLAWIAGAALTLLGEVGAGAANGPDGRSPFMVSACILFWPLWWAWGLGLAMSRAVRPGKVDRAVDAAIEDLGARFDRHDELALRKARGDVLTGSEEAELARLRVLIDSAMPSPPALPADVRRIVDRLRRKKGTS